MNRRFSQAKVMDVLGVVLLGVVAVMGVQLSRATESRAAGFHQYSVALETSAHGQYDGIAGRHKIYLDTTSCAYEPYWLLFQNQHWIEMGIAHNCGIGQASTHVYEYLSAPDGSFTGFLGSQAINPNGSEHFFQIVRNSYGFTISVDEGDFFQESLVVNNATGEDLETGLESYDGTAVLHSHASYFLRRKVQGDWDDWAGFDSSIVNTPVMCGGWNTAASWRSSEHYPC